MSTDLRVSQLAVVTLAQNVADLRVSQFCVITLVMNNLVVDAEGAAADAAAHNAGLTAAGGTAAALASGQDASETLQSQGAAANASAQPVGLGLSGLGAVAVGAVREAFVGVGGFPAVAEAWAGTGTNAMLMGQRLQIEVDLREARRLSWEASARRQILFEVRDDGV